jgi:hypothetical protein
MDMKGMMFAGGGLLVSMIVTTVWISGDVTRMREQERAKREAACMAQAQEARAMQQTAAAESSVMTINGAAANSQVDPACEKFLAGTGAGTPAVDPATGQPLAGAIDPMTGLPTGDSGSGGMSDPSAGTSGDPYADPYASSTYPDPYAAPADTGGF